MVSGRACRGGMWWLVLAIAACGQRDRLTFPTDPGTGGAPLGPTTIIIEPIALDTLVTRGDVIQVRGLSTDPDGVDSVYFELDGVDFTLSPIAAQGLDTVDFAFPLSTNSFVGDTVVLRVFGVDVPGSQGDFVSRRFRLR
jgi:hypothetical protein